MAAPRSRLAAVLRAGQARLATTGGGLVRAKELLKKKRRKERAEELYAQCIREMTRAQETYKGRMGAAKLAEWARQGLVYPDPVAIAELVYDCVMRDEEADALYYIHYNVERSLHPPQAVEDQERAREAAREVRRRLRSADDENESDESEGEVIILDAWECADERGGGGGDDSDSNATVEYGALSDDEVAREAPAPVQSDEAVARRMCAEWNSRGGGRVRAPPSRLVPSMGGTNSGPVREERR